MLGVDAAASANDGDTLLGDPLLGMLRKLVLLLLALARPGVGVMGKDLATVRVDQPLRNSLTRWNFLQLRIDRV